MTTERRAVQAEDMIRTHPDDARRPDPLRCQDPIAAVPE